MTELVIGGNRKRCMGKKAFFYLYIVNYRDAQMLIGFTQMKLIFLEVSDTHN